MLQRIRDARENENGFTLIELLIVIVILGVLSAIVVFSVQAFNNDGKLSACQADKKNVEIAGEAYFAKTGTQAASVADLVPTYLKEAPSTKYYTISTAGGAVTVGAGAGGVAAPAGC